MPRSKLSLYEAFRSAKGSAGGPPIATVEASKPVVAEPPPPPKVPRRAVYRASARPTAGDDVRFDPAALRRFARVAAAVGVLGGVYLVGRVAWKGATDLALSAASTSGGGAEDLTYGVRVAAFPGNEAGQKAATELLTLLGEEDFPDGKGVQIRGSGEYRVYVGRASQRDDGTLADLAEKVVAKLRETELADPADIVIEELPIVR